MKDEKIIWPKDSSEMVLIPAGSFEMGDHLDNMSNALPVHTVELDAFYIDIHEVTVGRYKQFLAETGHRQPSWNDVNEYSPTDDHPIIYVSWNDATVYAKWVGKRLPTEAEWECSAHGGLAGKRYPWGDEVTHDDANWGNTASGKGRWNHSSPVGSFEANGCGLFDMAGNVWEWCADWYDGNYYKNSPAKNPPGPGAGQDQVVRGGSWYDRTNHLRLAYRLNNAPNCGYFNCGFRCVSDLT